MKRPMHLALTFLALSACSSTQTTGGTTGGNPTAALDGTWDITQSGTGAIGPSQMTVSKGSVSGYVAQPDEGQMDPRQPGCTYSKDRTEFTFTAAGNSLTATVATRIEWTGSNCQKNILDQATLTGTRTASAPNSSTELNGDWTVTPEGEQPFAVVVDGLNAKAWDTVDDKTANKTAVLTVAIAGDTATVSANDPVLSFAAKRR